MDRKPLSAKKVIAILVRDYSFEIVSKRGSHIKLRKNGCTTIVPDHKELAFGTLRSILKLAGIEEKDFWKKVT